MANFLNWLHRHGAVTITVILWAVGLTTWVTWRVFGDNPPDIPTGTAAAFATLFGLPTLAVGFWKWKADKLK